MQFPALNRIGALRKRLGPIMKELGVKPKLNRESEGYRQGIFFGNASASVVCPVAIFLPDRGDSGWNGCEMVSGHFYKMDVGHNGWAHYRDQGYTTQEMLGEDLDKAFDDIGKALISAGAIEQYDGHKKITTDEDFADVFEELERALSPFPDTEIICKRINGIESLNFVGPFDEKWKLSFENQLVTIRIDGLESGEIASSDHATISNVVRSRLFAPTSEHRTSGLR